jgi:hypothetical protein
MGLPCTYSPAIPSKRSQLSVSLAGVQWRVCPALGPLAGLIEGIHWQCSPGNSSSVSGGWGSGSGSVGHGSSGINVCLKSVLVRECT